MIIKPEDLDHSVKEVDVAIIGSGAGGSMAAATFISDDSCRFVGKFLRFMKRWGRRKQ